MLQPRRLWSWREPGVYIALLLGHLLQKQWLKLSVEKLFHIYHCFLNGLIHFRQKVIFQHNVVIHLSLK